MVPVKAFVSSIYLLNYVVKANDQERQIELDLLEEKQQLSYARTTYYKNILARYYYSRVRE